MISRIKIIYTELTPKAKKLDWMLKNIDSDYGSKILYEWQWDKIERPELDPKKIYDLSKFMHGFDGFDDGLRLNIYGKSPQFLFEADNTFFRNVLTNIEPQTEDLLLYSPRRELREININDLFKI